ncbi:hypothetical protein [Pseudomonas citronellolis]|uniref:hypothetical protein n=1 Tax=Pseudomonas citronellolis TaxID=53408 RepID=UPI002FDB49C0
MVIPRRHIDCRDDSTVYYNALEGLAADNPKIASRFSRKTIYKFIEDRLPHIKKSGEVPGASEVFFKELIEQDPTSMVVSVPISGIRLDNGIKTFELACFRFGYLRDLEVPIANQHGMYISTTIKDVYDKEIALQKAESEFINFAKLIVFLSGKQDKIILIETGLPLKPDLTHERMYVSISSYQIQDEQGRVFLEEIKNTHIEKIPVNHDFFSSKEMLRQSCRAFFLQRPLA